MIPVGILVLSTPLLCGDSKAQQGSRLSHLQPMEREQQRVHSSFRPLPLPCTGQGLGN